MNHSLTPMMRASVKLDEAFNRAAFSGIDRHARYTNMFLLAGSAVTLIFSPVTSYIMLDTLLTMNAILCGYKFFMTKYRPVPEMDLTRALGQAREALQEEENLPDDLKTALEDHLSDATEGAGQAIGHLRKIEREHLITNAASYGAMMIGSGLSAGGPMFLFTSICVLGLSAYYNHHATRERLDVSNHVMLPMMQAAMKSLQNRNNGP